MQTATDLNEAFGLPDVLSFDEPHPGMPRARIATPACTGEFYLQGAHLTQWQPAGQQPALYLSERSTYVPGKAIRGGIPVIFPWFGDAETSPVATPPKAPKHGFARTSPWTLRFAALAGEDLHLSATLDPSDEIKALGFSGFELAYEAVLGRTLRVRLSVANTGDAPLLIEEALHAYLAVGDSRQVSVLGLEGTEYLDKTEGFKRKEQTDTALRFAGETDRPYLNTSAPLTLLDPLWERRMQLTKAGSRTSVTWNPGEELAATLPDLGAGDWNRFVCLETANVGENAVTVRPHEAHTVEMTLALAAL